MKRARVRARPTEVVRKMRNDDEADENGRVERTGQVGEILALRHLHQIGWVPDGCALAHGHRRRQFANLADARHLDFLACDLEAGTVHAICEVKTTVDAGARRFPANGECAEMMHRAQAAGIRLCMAVVRLKAEPPSAALETPGARTHYAQLLLQQDDAYAIEFYEGSAFELRGDEFVIAGERRDVGEA
jgi:hypothetical protein